MSARLSTALPRACSGAIYAAVPMITPAPVANAMVPMAIVNLMERYGVNIYGWCLMHNH